ncbi:MAG: hypothetical protein OEV64_11480 [Desulfobulbaceae bacterium]|nr:hypothetical protein [Desulfobulbaceae bacterium]
MASSEGIITPSTNLKNAIRYLSEAVAEHPEIKRKEILSKAELRFDLTPRECEFLNANFQKVIEQKS